MDENAAWGSVVRGNGVCERFMMGPDDKAPTCWSLLSALFIAFDVATLPLMVFGVEPMNLSVGLVWIMAFWWTMDIVLHLLTGYHDNGSIEMRPSKVFYAYARTWLVLDITTCATDWASLISEYATRGSQDTTVLDAGKGLRTLRLMRFMRLVRIYKVVQLIVRILDGLPTSSAVTAMNMSSALLCISLISHYVACGWCWLGGAGLRHSWVDEILWDQTPLHLYAMALHWSLTQYMAAPMDISPSNLFERFYAICVVLSAFCVFCGLIGGITAKITELRQRKLGELNNQQMLRQYLHDRKIRLVVGHGIWSFLRNQRRTSRAALHEADLQLLAQIPTNLRMALRHDVFMPALKQHPFFERLAGDHAFFLSTLCFKAMTEVSARTMEDVFVAEHEAPGCFMLVSGKVEYQTTLLRNPLSVRAYGDVAYRNSFAEAALWGAWCHCGQLTALDFSELALLSTEKFRGAALQTHATAKSVLQGYARAFARLMTVTNVDDSDNVTPNVTDVIRDDAQFLNQVERLMPSREPSLLKRSLSSTSVSSRFRVRGLKPALTRGLSAASDVGRQWSQKSRRTSTESGVGHRRTSIESGAAPSIRASLSSVDEELSASQDAESGGAS